MSTIKPQDIQAYTQQLTQEHHIPAISLALWKDGQLHQAASGILNLDTGVEATTDSIFQIGSITKVFTTSLVMRLVEMGRVDLDKKKWTGTLIKKSGQAL